MNNNETPEEKSMPWYKEFWGWFVFTPLFVVIIVCSIFATLAFKYKDDVISDDHYKQGRMVNYRFTAENNARKLGIQGTMRFDALTEEVIVDLDNSLPSQNTISLEDTISPHTTMVLELSHPAHANKDQSITLSRISDKRYRGDVEGRLSNRWYIVLSGAYLEASSSIQDPAQAPTEQQWRISGEINFDHTSSAKF